MGLFKRWRAKRAAKKQLKTEQKVQAEEKVAVSEPKKEEVKQQEPAKHETKQQEPAKHETKQQEPAKKVEKHAHDDGDKTFRYHVSQNKDKKSAYFKQWRVRRSGSSKTIKYFDTQKEAIDYAEDLAEKNNTSVVIHKLDGSIRKQNY